MSKFFLNLLRLEAVRNHNDPQVARTLIHHGMFARVRFSVTVRAVIAYRWWKRASFRELLFLSCKGAANNETLAKFFEAQAYCSKAQVVSHNLWGLGCTRRTDTASSRTRGVTPA